VQQHALTGVVAREAICHHPRVALGREGETQRLNRLAPITVADVIQADANADAVGATRDEIPVDHHANERPVVRSLNDPGAISTAGRSEEGAHRRCIRHRIRRVPVQVRQPFRAADAEIQEMIQLVIMDRSLTEGRDEP